MTQVDAVVVYIGLGSNIEQPFVQIKNALHKLADLPGTEVLQDSGYFVSSPMGPEDQPDFVNAVTQISTTLGSSELLEQCQKIEQRQGRIKTRHWGERSIDLDILLYGDEVIDTDTLKVPHPGIIQRDFVYMPLLKINPDVILPGSGMLSDLVSSTSSSTEYDCQFAGNIE